MEFAAGLSMRDMNEKAMKGTHLLDEFDGAVQQIARFPYAHELYRTDRPMQDEIRKVPVKDYVLYYAVFPDYVEIRAHLL